MLELWQLLLLTIIGIFAGWVNVLAGGGSLLSVPALVLFGLPGPVANGTNRIAIIGQNIVAVSTFFRQGFSDFRLSASLAACASIGAYAGAHIGVQLDGEWFDRVLAIVMVAVMILMATGNNERKQVLVGEKPRNLILGHILMVGAGLWGGFIQIGVGFILMPILYRVMGIDLVRVNMHKVFIALVFSFVALAVFMSNVQIAWQAGIALAIGNALGGFLGARTTVAKGAPFVKMVLYVVVAAMVIKLLFL